MLVKFIKVSSATLENSVAVHQRYFSRLDTLLASQSYFNSKVNEMPESSFLIPLEAEIDLCEAYLKRYPKIPTIGELSRNQLNELETGLKILVNDLRFFISVDNMISDQAIDALCPMIIAEFPGLALEDVGICFAQAKKGYYEKLFNRLDGVIIMGWLRLYQTDKLKRLSERNYVAESHHRIGLDEGRSHFAGNHHQLVQTAFDVLALQMAKKSKKT